MIYIALLRGINVGGQRKVAMAKLREILTSAGFSAVQTYLNSGNVLLETDREKSVITDLIVGSIYREFGVEVQILIKNQKDIQHIVNQIPMDWLNDQQQKTDVAFLFKEIDDEAILDELPIARQYVDIRYVEGAIFWNVERMNYNKSRLNKIISHKLYQSMTVRNINTARKLVDWSTEK